MSTHKPTTNNESSDDERNGRTRDDAPFHGLARALLDADPDTPLNELPEIVAKVPRMECTSCGNQRFVRPDHCGGCGGEKFVKVIPAERGSR